MPTITVEEFPLYPAAYTTCQWPLGFPTRDLSSSTLWSDKWADSEVRLDCVKFGIAITLPFPDRMFSLLYLALIIALIY